MSKAGKVTIRQATDFDADAVAALIYTSTNHWYETHGKPPIFQGPVESTRLFYDVYEALDPGCCLLAVAEEDGHLLGSCFYRERETHVSLGIMNAHPESAGRGVARQLLARIVSIAEAAAKPLRLVSSAVNLDSFSLYSKAGFAPYAVYQDMIWTVPEEGVPVEAPAGTRLRDATIEDVPAIVALEEAVQGVRPS